MPKDPANSQPSAKPAVYAHDTSKSLKDTTPSSVAGAEQAMANEKKALESGEESPT
jgi:hypothetical protein